MFSFCIPTEFVFGTGCFKELHKYNLPGKKALIVITNGKSIRNSGYLAELENQLSLAGKEYEVFDGITPNPTTDSIMDAAKTAKDSACDFIIGFGGGSPMDWRRPILETFGIIDRKAPAEESCRRISLFLSYVFPPQPEPVPKQTTVVWSQIRSHTKNWASASKVSSPFSLL